jgi:flagellar hook-length control protein FliK
MGQAEQQRFVQRVIGAFHAARDGGGELRLRLSPPELGSLRLHLKLGGDALTARIEVETAAARSILLDNLPVLRGRLAEQGFRVEQFDVDLADQHSNGPPNGQAGSQGGRQDAPWLPSDSSGEMGGGEPGANRPPTPSNRDNSQLNVIV